MYLSERIDRIITTINEDKHTNEQTHQLINEICELFEIASHEEELSDNSLSLLYYLANYIGVPHYYDLLCKSKNITNIVPNVNLITFSSMVKESNLYIDKDTKFHVYQKEVIDRFQMNQKNRFLISASTSFGKTYLIYSILKKMNYKNLLLIFPTVSLLSENLQRFLNLNEKGEFNKYKIITLSEEKLSEDNNILIFTPERFMTFIDKNKDVKLDFVFMDEIYKIDNDFISTDGDEIIENSRDIAFRVALELSLKKTRDLLLAGPFLTLNSKSFLNFIKDNEIIILDYNFVDLVNRSQTTVKKLKNAEFDGIRFEKILSNDSKSEKLYKILKQLKFEQSIVYCYSKASAEEYALKISEKNLFTIISNIEFDIFIKHLEEKFSKDWSLIKCLKNGIGIHHGTIPKYIQKEIINFFNNGVINCIFSTTTITEGVNTTAKNMVIMSTKKGRKDLKKFDVLNIIGRAGRFLKHFTGRVFFIEDKIEDILDEQSSSIEHKNYDSEKNKSDVDLEITKDEYLTSQDKQQKHIINDNYDKNNIPVEIREAFVSIKPQEKIKLFNKLTNIISNGNKFKEFIRSLNYGMLSQEKIQWLLEIIDYALDEDAQLKKYFNKGKNEYFLLTYKLYSYLYGGYNNLLEFSLRINKIDNAMREVSNIVYSVFKYELVKYISLIDLIYRFLTAKKDKILIDDVPGLFSLLSFLEYGAFTEVGRKVSDFGVPFNVLRFVENNEVSLDSYENKVLSNVQFLLNK